MTTLCLRALLFIFIACLIASCDNTTESPDDGGSDFRVVSVLGDSLYGGEELRVVARGAGTDTAALSVMIHSLNAQITGLSGDTLAIEIPRGAESGAIRIYKHDSVLAAGEHSIAIIPQHVDDLVGQGIDVRYRESFRGDTLTIVFQDLPLTDRPMRLTLNDRPLEYVRRDPDTLRVGVPMDAVSGDLEVYLFGKRVLQRPIDISADTVFLSTGAIRNVTFGAYAVWASLELAYKTPTAEAIESAGSDLTAATTIDVPTDGAISHSGDTLIIESSRFENGLAWRVQARLIPSGANKWSGRISCMKIENYGAWNAKGSSFCIEMRDMRWKRQEGKYVLYAYGDDIKQNVTDLCFQHFTTPSSGIGNVLYLVKYFGNIHKDSRLEIMLEP